MGEKTIPILPCPPIPDVVAFYQALGFEVIHLQTRPNPYASLRYGDIELQFFGRLPDEAAGAELTDAQRASLSDDLARADDLRESLRA